MKLKEALSIAKLKHRKPPKITRTRRYNDADRAYYLKNKTKMDAASKEYYRKHLAQRLNAKK